MRRLLVAVGLVLATFAGGQLPTDPLPPLPPVTWREESRDEDIVEERASVPSAILSGKEKNDLIPLRLIRPAESRGRIPVVLILHYWGASDQRAELALARDLARRGSAGLLMALPYHLERAPVGTRSGELAITVDPDRIRATLLQGSADCRRAIDAALARPDLDPERVGIVGISLGALVSSLATAVDPRISRAAFLLGGIDFARIVWTSSLVTAQRDAMRRAGVTETKLRERLADVEPATYLRPRAGLQSLVISGRFDTVVPPEATEKLATALGDPARLTIDTGHYGGIFVQRKLLREVATFLSRSFAGEAYRSPRSLYAPTLRLGIKADYPTGLDVGVGLDLYRFDRRGDGIASVFLTPRGLQLFVGGRVWRGLHLGVTAAPRGLAVGAMWSVVL